MEEKSKDQKKPEQKSMSNKEKSFSKEQASFNEPRKENKEEGSAKEEGVNVMALISYLWALCLVPLLSEKGDDFAMFHAKQGLVLFIAEMAAWIIFSIIPFLWFLNTILGIVWLIFSILGIMNVVNGEKKELPFLGQFADKLNF